MFGWPDVIGLVLACAITLYLVRWFNREIDEEVAEKQTQGDLNALADKAKRDVEGADLNTLAKRLDERYRTRRDRKK